MSTRTSFDLDGFGLRWHPQGFDDARSVAHRRAIARLREDELDPALEALLDEIDALLEAWNDDELLACRPMVVNTCGNTACSNCGDQAREHPCPGQMGYFALYEEPLNDRGRPPEA